MRQPAAGPIEIRGMKPLLSPSAIMMMAGVRVLPPNVQPRAPAYPRDVTVHLSLRSMYTGGFQ